MCGYQQVLRFDVSVHDVHPVQVFDGSSQVKDHGAGITLAVLRGGGDGVEQVASLKTQEMHEEGEKSQKVPAAGGRGAP